MHKMFGIVAFLDYGLPFSLKLKNIIRVRHNHWPKLNYDFTGQIHEFQVRYEIRNPKSVDTRSICIVRKGYGLITHICGPKKELIIGAKRQ
jgi:hypothetical protein